MHVEASEVTLDNNSKIFAGLAQKNSVARYHSLIAAKNQFPDCLKITVQTQKGEIMAVEHQTIQYMGCSSIQNKI